MNQPRLEVLPLRRGVTNDQLTTLEVMVRITPPDIPSEAERPPLNLSLVIDRSGSMQGEKLKFAKQAAIYAVESLLVNDRVCVVTYDNIIRTIVPSTLAGNKESIIREIRQLQPGGSTALHAGWLDGATQVSLHLDPERLNRVILLSDGLANVGETNPDVIASDVAGLKQHGVSTSTMGIGRDFNEDLLQAMAASGEGNFYFIESPTTLPKICSAELQGLVTTRGTGVRLQLRSNMGAEVIEILNDFRTDEQGRLVLPNLIAGMPILLAGVLRIPPKNQAEPIAELTLSWDDMDTGTRQRLTYTFDLPAMPSAELKRLPADPEVEGYMAEMRAARAKEEAVRHLDSGDKQKMNWYLNQARRHIEAAPDSARKQAELRELSSLEEAVRTDDEVIARKRMKDQVYRKKFSRELEGARGGERIAVVMGDITQEHVDAIVNPTNTRLFGAGGTDGAVHRAGGPELTRACREIGYCEPGRAVFTEGYNLLARFVIHTVGPRWQGGHSNEARILANCYRNSLMLARKLGVRAIAFPSISTGAYGYPLDQAATIALQEVQDFLSHDTSIQQVRFVCFDSQTFDAYQEALQGQRLSS